LKDGSGIYKEEAEPSLDDLAGPSDEELAQEVELEEEEPE
jgi:hypothetical protein